MNPIWKISGEFYGWLSESGWFYNSEGKRQGTMQDSILYDYNGKYCGELISEVFIGYNPSRSYLEGPHCYLDGEVDMDPLPPRNSCYAIGYVDPN